MEEQIKSNMSKMEETPQNTENQVLENSPSPALAPVCRSCGNPDIEGGYTLELCANCRTELSKTKLPIWVKGFGLLVLLIMVFSMVKFPAGLQKGILLERGERSEAAKNYTSALKYYTEFSIAYPDSAKVKGKLFISQYYCEKYGDAIQTYNELIGKDFDDSVLDEIKTVVTKINMYIVPDENAAKLMESIKDYANDKKIVELNSYLQSNSQDIYTKLYLASIYREEKNYEEAKNTAIDIVDKFPDYFDALFTLGAIYRESGKYDEAIATYNKILEINKENADAFSGIARIELMRKNDKEALKLALKAYGFEPNNSFVLSNLVLAYHFNNMPGDRDKALGAYKATNPDTKQMQFINNAISSDSSFRN